MRPGARAHTLEAPFAYLEHAGLVCRHYEAAQARAPLTKRTGGTFSKVYLCDVGLLSAQLGVRPDAFLDESTYRLLSASFRGALAENFVKQALEANQVPSMYWRNGNTAEFGLENGLKSVPLYAAFCLTGESVTGGPA